MKAAVAMATLVADTTLSAPDARFPGGCDTCAPARGSVAAWVITFTPRVGGRLVVESWHICHACLPSCQRAAVAAHQGPRRPRVKAVAAWA